MVTDYLAFNPAGMAAGTYSFTLFVNTGDPNLAVTVLPISFTIYASPPASPQLKALSKTDSQFVFQLLGSTNVPYIVQSSTNLLTWVPASTNTLFGGALNVTNAVIPGWSVQFWRAVWRP